MKTRVVADDTGTVEGATNIVPDPFDEALIENADDAAGVVSAEVETETVCDDDANGGFVTDETATFSESPAVIAFGTTKVTDDPDTDGPALTVPDPVECVESVIT